MNKTKVLLLLLVCIVAGVASSDISASETLSLPTIEIQGKEYYIYEVKKDESAYGIAKRFNWDLNELQRLNHDATERLSKGRRLYYPVNDKTETATQKKAEVPKASEKNDEPLHHTVKKGETIYSIAKQYSVSPDLIYAANPSAKRGVKTGDRLEIPRGNNSRYQYYSVKPGDTLYSLGQKFNTSVEDILKDNPGVTQDNFRSGEILRISRDSRNEKTSKEVVEEQQVKYISSYKVRDDDSWERISQKTGVDESTLKEANKETQKLKSNQIIHVPVIETVEVEKERSFFDNRELSQEGIGEIYDSIHGITADPDLQATMKIALVLDDPNSNRDIDFTRGVLVGLSDYKLKEPQIDFKVIDGRVSSSELLTNLEEYSPALIISTADKTFPLILADYGNTNNVEVVNVFDVRNDLYEENASIIQLLPPSSYYSEHVGGKIYKDNRRRRLITVGEKDESDNVAEVLTGKYGSDIINLNIEELSTYQPDPMESYLIYSYATKKGDIADFLQGIENLIEQNPGADFKIIGRGNWVALIDDFGDKFKEYGVIVPSRVWLDENSDEWKEFCAKYESLFEGSPLKTMPNFAASGFDTINYFTDALAFNKGDFNDSRLYNTKKMLQGDINLQRVNNWGGFVNIVSYVLKFTPEGDIEKILAD